MYEEGYLSEKSKENTKNIIVKYKEHLKKVEGEKEKELRILQRDNRNYNERHHIYPRF